MSQQGRNLWKDSPGAAGAGGMADQPPVLRQVGGGPTSWTDPADEQQRTVSALLPFQHQLRRLAEEALWTMPSQAVFYASLLVHMKKKKKNGTESDAMHQGNASRSSQTPASSTTSANSRAPPSAVSRKDGDTEDDGDDDDLILLLARAHHQTHNYAACWRVLMQENEEELVSAISNGGSRLMTQPLVVLEQQGEPSSDGTNYSYPYQGWEAVWMACAALAATDDWLRVVELVEDACRRCFLGQSPGSNTPRTHAGSGPPTSVGTTNSSNAGGSRSRVVHFQSDQRPDREHDLHEDVSPHTTDEEEIAALWAIQQQAKASTALKRKTEQEKLDINRNLYQQQTSSSFALDPIARLCSWRGRAYYETGHSQRACRYWMVALRMDVQCQEAWEALLERHLLTPAQAYELLKELDFDRSSEENDQDWLYCLYLGRIELTQQAPTTMESVPASASLARRTGAASTAVAASTPSFAQDASSIQLLSPDFAFTTPKSTLMGGGKEGGTFSKGYKAPATLPSGQQKSTSLTLQADVDQAFDKLFNTYRLQDCPHVLCMAARRSYRRCQWKQALQYCQQLARMDPTMSDAAYVYVATLVILGHTRSLFLLAHQWVESSPTASQAWFAVGAYYYCCGRYHIAQRHFARATRLEPGTTGSGGATATSSGSRMTSSSGSRCTEAWIALGCAFAACDESDQALASFRAAQRLSPGEHYSLLYMGMEYVRTNHLVLAQYFLSSALQASTSGKTDDSDGGDPLCLHELGVLSALKGEREEAIGYFERALAAVVSDDIANSGQDEHVDYSSSESMIDLCSDAYWEPTLFNLGHCYRKTRQFEKAALCFQRCIALCPEKFSPYSALAFTKHLHGELDGAINYYHQALSVKPNDPFSTEMLNRALRESLSSPLAIDENNPALVASIESGTPKSMGKASILSPNSEWSRSKTYDSMMSEENTNMDIDVDMSG